MGIGPGNIANMIPPRADDPQRKARDLARTQREQAAGRILDASSFNSGAALGPIMPTQASQTLTGFAIPQMPSTAQQAQVTITVPTGYTNAVVTATVQGGGNAPSNDYLYVHAAINGVIHQQVALPPLTSGTLPAGGIDTFTTILNGLTAGAGITCGAVLGTNNAAWPISATNGASVDATVIFF